MSGINLDGFLDIAPEEPPQETHVDTRGTNTHKRKKTITHRGI